MNNIIRGLAAGAAATAVLSMLMLAKTMMGVMPELDVVSMLSTMMGASGNAALGWSAHVMIGVLGYGLAMALVGSRLPGLRAILKGVMIGFGGWLIMMAMLMPMAGAGYFGMAMGMMAPMMTLALHLVFGAALGAVYGLTARQGAAA